MSTRTPAPPAPTQAGRARPRRPWWQIVLLVVLSIALLIALLFIVPWIAVWINFQRGPTTTTDCSKAANPASSGAVMEYCLSTRTQPPHAMTVGPDGNLWFTDAYNGKLVRVSLKGTFTSFTVPVRPTGEPVPGIARGADGNLWYIAAGKLGRLSPQGTTSSVDLPAGVVATSLAAGPDGNLWLSESRGTGSTAKKTADTIAKVTPSGQFTSYPLAAAGLVSAGGLTPGRDGNVWFVGITRSSSAIGRITPTGTVTVFPQDIPVQTTAPGYPACEPTDNGPCVAGSNIGGLVAGGDGNLWFVDGQGRIGRMTPTGTTTYFHDLQGASGPPIGIGPDGNTWVPVFTSNGVGSGTIARVTANGTVTRFPLPHQGSILAITAGPDGGVWFLLVAGGGMEPQSTQRVVRFTP